MPNFVATTAEITETKTEKEKGRAVFSPWGSITHAIEYYLNFLKTDEALISIVVSG